MDSKQVTDKHVIDIIQSSQGIKSNSNRFLIYIGFIGNKIRWDKYPILHLIEQGVATDQILVT